MNLPLRAYKKFSRFVNYLLPAKAMHRYAFIKWKIRNVFFRKKKLVKIEVNDQTFFINIDPRNGYVDENIYLHQEWDTDVGNCIHKNLSKDDVFIDVGANIGYFSLLASAIVEDEGSVISFEPISHLADMCKESAKCNKAKNMRVVNKACGENDAKSTIYLMNNNIGASSLFQRDVNGEALEIDVTTLDNELLNQKRIDFIKVDAEGYEYEVLRGGMRLISKFRPKIILEFSPILHNLRGDETITNSLIDLIEELEYDAFYVRRGGEVEAVKDTLANCWQNDILCLPR